MTVPSAGGGRRDLWPWWVRCKVNRQRSGGVGGEREWEGEGEESRAVSVPNFPALSHKMLLDSRYLCVLTVTL